MLRHEFESILRTTIPVIVLTDSEMLFNIITRRRPTTEKRLMIDLRAVREAYQDRSISNIALIASEYNVADSMTKITSNDSLRKLLATFRISHQIRQYIIEPRKALNEQPQTSERPRSVNA